MLPKPVLAGVVVVVTLVGAFIVYGQREIIPFQTIEWGAGSGGYPQAASLVINNQSTWAEVWTRAFCSNLSPPEYCPSLPKVNFTSSTVIAAFYGTSGCFGCQLINVTEVSRIGPSTFVHVQRTVADPIALKRAYASGAIDEANNLNQVAIIDLRGPDPGAFHDVYRTYAMRARLMRDFGTAANQVLWRGQAPLIGDPGYADQAIFAEDQWLGRVAGDHRNLSLPQKIVDDKPGSVADRCTNGAGTAVPSYVCDATVAAYGTPRFGADEPLTDDIWKCQLKPLRRDDYPVSFTDDQWARLQRTFAGGVCDYGKPGVGQRPTMPWLTYQDARGQVIYGGRPMGAAPVSHPFGPARHRHATRVTFSIRTVLRFTG